MNSNSVKTVNFSRLDALRSWGMPFTIRPHTTLNEKFNIGNINPPSSGYPTLKYITIGRKGHGNIVGEGDDTLTDTKYHGANNNALFEHIPFIMVPTTNDLSPQERAKYRICVVETYEDVDYYCYYGMVFDVGTPTIETRIIEFRDGVIVADDPYIESVADLSPVPVDISSVNVNVADGRHLITQGVVRITLGAKEINDIVSACITKYGKIQYATISEIGIVGGFDATITSNAGGQTRTFTELRTGQIMTFISTEQKLQNLPNAITIDCALANDMPYPPAVA